MACSMKLSIDSGTAISSLAWRWGSGNRVHYSDAGPGQGAWAANAG